jgi:hypothetical protein
MSSLSIIALLWFLLVSATNAANLCAERGSENFRCYCNKDAQRIPVPTPDGFSLFAVCGMWDIKDNISISPKLAKTLPPERLMGHYYYRGHKTMTGKIVKAYSPIADATIIFHPAQPALRRTNTRNLSSFHEFASLTNLSLEGDEKKSGTQNLEVSEAVSWCSEATITVQEIEIFLAETEGTGPLATKYHIVRRSKFRKC